MKKTLIKIALYVSYSFTLAFFAFIVVLICLLVLPEYETKNIQRYGKYLYEPYTLELFPETLDRVETVNKYFYKQYSFVPCCAVILDVNYNEDNFKTEIDRLTYFKVKRDDYYVNISIDKDLENFNYETYIVKYDLECEYEYACVDYDNNRVIYVYLLHFPTSKKEIEESILPKNYYSQ